VGNYCVVNYRHNRPIGYYVIQKRYSTFLIAEIFKLPKSSLYNTAILQSGIAILLKSNSTLCGKKLHLFYFCNNFVKPPYISIICGVQIVKWICNKAATKLSAYPDGCSHPTLWNETLVNLFISTVMYALKVMKVTEKYYSKCSVFAFDSETCNKTILPLINRLINEALLVADHVSIRCCFSSLTSLTGFW